MARIPETWENVFSVDGELNLISTDLLIDMLKKASDQSKEMIASQEKEFSIWELRNYRKLVSFVFDLCSSLGIDDAYVRYNSCELYEEFLHQHIINLKLEISKVELNENEKSLWVNIRNQALLRLLSCIMLSGKINSIRSTKSLNDYLKLIKSFGQHYNKMAIVRSEIRVLKTVNFKIDRCLLHSICPLLILTLVYNEPSIKGKLLFSILYKIMDYFYLAKPDIFKRLYEALRRSKTISTDVFKNFISDSMLLGCAIVAVTPMLVDEQAGPQVLSELAYITCYSQEEIGIIRDVILDGVLGS